jgi:DNA-directed RNA polymerase delta subunit
MKVEGKQLKTRKDIEMAKVTKQIVDKDLRDRVFNDIFDELEHTNEYDYVKINDRQFGVLLTDLNGEQRYVRIGAIVAELREDMTAEELMKSEIKAYQDKVNAKAEKAKEKEKKIAEDKAKREKEKEEKANEN